MKPVLYVIPGLHLPLFGYGVMLLLSLVSGWYLTVWLCGRDGLDRKSVERINGATGLGTLVGAKLLYVATNYHPAEGNLVPLLLNSGGLVAYGALIGGYAGAALCCLRYRLPLRTWGEGAVPGMCLAFGLTRIGCLLAGCDFGKVVRADAWYAVRFPAGSPAFMQHLQDAPALMAGATRSLPVHPTQIYESLLGFALLPVMLLVRRFRRVPGETFVAFLVLYGVARLLLERLRGDGDRGTVGPLSTSEFLAVLSLLLAGAEWLYLRSRPQPARTI